MLAFPRAELWTEGALTCVLLRRCGPVPYVIHVLEDGRVIAAEPCQDRDGALHRSVMLRSILVDGPR